MPGVASADAGRFCCARCGEGLDRSPQTGQTAKPQPANGARPSESSERPKVADAARRPCWDDWELDEQLGDIRRKLKPAKAARADNETTVDREPVRLESGHAGPPAWHCTPQPSKKSSDPKPDSAPTASGAGLVWFVLAIGLMGLVCGGVLLGWSVATGRQDLWNRGIPFAVGGQVALLFGLALQLERIWRDGRRTATRLEHVDEELHGLKSTTAMLGTTHSSAASSFYCHMAGGANSQLLLNDLKGQLDMLAVKIGQQEQHRA